MAFQPEDFMNDVSWEVFDGLKKPQLMSLAQYLELEVKHAMRKQVIKNMLIDRLVEDDIWDESYLDNKIDMDDVTDNAIKLKQMEMQKEIEMEKLRMAKEKQEEEMKLQKVLKQQELEAKLKMEEKERQQKIEMEEKDRKQRLEMEKEIKLKEIEAKVNSSSQSSHATKFDPTKYVRLVPEFQEKEVDKYFVHFEKIASSMEWPKAYWAIMVQGKFVNKASDAYSALPLEDSNDYDKVKQAVLKAYQLVPEAYRQKFRAERKAAEQTHVEFARVKEQLFDRWLGAKEIQEDFGKLRELMLVEEFKRCVHADIRTHLDESKVTSLNEVATRADDYALTHKLSASKPNQYQKKIKIKAKVTQIKVMLKKQSHKQAPQKMMESLVVQSQVPNPKTGMVTRK